MAGCLRRALPQRRQAVACIWAGCPYIHTGFFDPDVAVDQLIEHKVTVSLSAFETIWLPVVNHSRWAEVDQSRLRMVVMVWEDGGYGLISWKQENEFFRRSHHVAIPTQTGCSWQRLLVGMATW